MPDDIDALVAEARVLSDCTKRGCLDDRCRMIADLADALSAARAVIEEAKAYALRPVVNEVDGDGDYLLDHAYIDGANGARRDVLRILSKFPIGETEEARDA